MSPQLGYIVEVPLAFQAAVAADPAIGLLLPCNVTVEWVSDTQSRVLLIGPRSMLAAAPGGLSPALGDFRNRPP